MMLKWIFLSVFSVLFLTGCFSIIDDWNPKTDTCEGTRILWDDWGYPD